MILAIPTTVAVIEWVDLGHHEHCQDGPLPCGVEVDETLVALGKRPVHQRRVDEERSARLVGQLLELARPFFGTAGHDDRMPGTEEVDELLRAGGDPRHLVGVAHDSDETPSSGCIRTGWTSPDALPR